MVILLGDGAWGGILAACIVAAFVAGFFVARVVIKKELKKNPPINEKMIRVMYQQMGVKPSEAKIRQIMKAMQDANK